MSGGQLSLSPTPTGDADARGGSDRPSRVFGPFQHRLFLVCGVTWAVDAAEIFLLSMALPGITREFGLSPAAGAATLLWAAADTAALVLVAAALVNFFSLGAWAALYAYTPERYPTQLRASDIGAASGYARIAGVVAPLTGGALLAVSLPAALSAFAAAFGVAALLVAAYARESRGSALEDTLDEVEAAAADPADDAARGRRR